MGGEARQPNYRYYTAKTRAAHAHSPAFVVARKAKDKQSATLARRAVTHCVFSLSSLVALMRTASDKPPGKTIHGRGRKCGEQAPQRKIKAALGNIC